MFVMGGYNDDDSHRASIGYRYNPLTGYVMLRNSHPGYYTSAWSAHNGRVYLAFGCSPPLSVDTPQYLLAAGPKCYDLQRQEWERLAVPVAAAGQREGACAAVVRDDLFLLAGKSTSGCITDVLRVNLTRPGSCVKVAPLPTPRSNAACAVCEDKIFVMGGSTSDDAVNTVECFDPRSDSWSSLSPMPVACEYAACAVHGRHIYIVGGMGPDGELDTLQRYDVHGDRWECLSSMPTRRWLLASCIFHGKLYATGGYSSQYGSVLDIVECYDPATDTWTTEEQCLPAPVYGHISYSWP